MNNGYFIDLANFFSTNAKFRVVKILHFRAYYFIKILQ